MRPPAYFRGASPGRQNPPHKASYRDIAYVTICQGPKGYARVAPWLKRLKSPALNGPIYLPRVTSRDSAAFLIVRSLDSPGPRCSSSLQIACPVPFSSIVSPRSYHGPAYPKAGCRRSRIVTRFTPLVISYWRLWIKNEGALHFPDGLGLRWQKEQRY